MAKFNIPEYRVSVDQLRTGVFIRLEGQWFEHPFLFNRFKIKSMDQVRTLKEAGVEEVICVPAKSDQLPKSKKDLETNPAPKTSKSEKKDPGFDKMMEVKKQRIDRLKTKREEIKRCEEKYKKSVKAIPDMMTGLSGGSPEAAENAGKLVDDMVETFLSERDAVVHLMESSGTDDGLYYHSLNVSVLSLMLGKAVELSEEELKALGMGALFHDIGKSRIEKKVLKKPFGSMTTPERKLIMLHPKFGVEMALKTGKFHNEALKAIFQHHERMNGKGYPQGVKGGKISKLARIVAITNIYDNLVNNPDQQKAKTPYQVMSFLFAKMKEALDQEIFAAFIRCMGIYPPGTIVQLSNDVIALVISVNQRNPLKPSLLAYDPAVPKDEAIVFDMEDEPELGVVKSIHPSDLPSDIFDYLSPRTQLNYYMENAPEKKSGTA